MIRFRPVIICVMSFLLCGCAILFSESHPLVTTIPANSSSPARFKTPLTISTHAVEFDGFQTQAGNQLLKITVINRGQSGFEMATEDGRFTPVLPGTPLEIYHAAVAHLTNSIRLPVSSVQQRTPCEFQIEVSNPAQFRNAIKVRLFNASAPL